MIFSVIEWLFCHCLSKILRLYINCKVGHSSSIFGPFILSLFSIYIYLVSFVQILLSQKIIPHINWWFQFICWNSWDYFFFRNLVLWTVVDKLYYELEQSKPLQWIQSNPTFCYWFEIPRIMEDKTYPKPWNAICWMNIAYKLRSIWNTFFCNNGMENTQIW